MITPSEIKNKAEKQYLACLIMWLEGQAFEKITILGNKIPPKSLKELEQAVLSLANSSKEKKGFGYTIDYQTIKTKAAGTQSLPVSIYFSSGIDFLKYLGKEKEFNRFKDDVDLITESIPQLREWIKSNPLKVIENAEAWKDLLKVCKHFMRDHIPGKYYIRELPINIHTKFIEQNKTILFSLLDHLIPEIVNPNAKGDFCQRYGLKDKETQIRIRILCDELKQTLPFSDFSIPLTDFKKTEFSASRIFIAENLMNFLTLPAMKDSIAIWSGGGFNISYLAETTWLKSRQIYYWGDIDVAGFHILSQLRSYYPGAKSIMMDKETFDKYFEGGEGKPIPVSELRGLNEEELSLYSFIRPKNLRLEQEKIPQEYALGNLGNL
jgi:hypothetical protein